MTTLFDERKVAAAVRTEADFEAALKSKVKVIFLQNSNIMNIGGMIESAHKAEKTVLIHMDFADGIGKDRVGLQYVKAQGADGILTTKTNMIKPAKELGLITVQRFFIVDSHSVDTAVESIRIAKPDVVELMPGIVDKKIKEFSNRIQTSIIAGGLIEFDHEVDAALNAGACAVSTANINLWDYK